MRVYRDTVGILVAGVLFFALGMGFGPLRVLYYIATGTPMMLRNSKLSDAVHVASTGEMALQFFAFLTFALLGLVLSLWWKLGVIEVDLFELRQRSLFGKVIFRAKWADLRSVTKRVGDRATKYVVESSQGTMEIPATENDLRDLLREIKERSPHLTFDPME